MRLPRLNVHRHRRIQFEADPLARGQSALPWWQPPKPRERPRVTFVVPEVRTKRGLRLMNFQIKNDTIVTVPLRALNAANQSEPLPAGDTYMVASSDPASLGVAMGQDTTGNPAAVLTPLVQGATNIEVTVTDADGLKAATLFVDVVQDDTPSQLVLDVADATTVTQPVPTATGSAGSGSATVGGSATGGDTTGGAAASP